MLSMSRLGHAFHACRRILILLALAACVAGGWAYLKAPSLNELRPELETLLKQELKLNNLHLGDLSWYWVGSTWIYAEDVSFATEDEQVQVQDGRLDVQLSSWDILLGRITPLSINLRGGQLSLQVPETGTPDLIDMPLLRLDLEDVRLAWKYGDESGAINNLHLHLDAPRRQLAIKLPNANLMLDWDEHLLPKNLSGQFQNIDWLPTKIRQYFRGTIGGRLQVVSSGEGQWRLQAKLKSESSASFTDGQGNTLFSFSEIETTLKLQTVKDTVIPQKIDIERLAWREGSSQIATTGQWQENALRLDLVSGALAMATMWPWLKDLDDDKAWHTWLSSMHEGHADLKSGRIEMDWPLQGPEASHWEAAQYQLRADVSGADITLVNGEPGLTDVSGSVELDEKGIRAEAKQAMLPKNAGQVHGVFKIEDWSSIVLDIDGQGDVDVGRLKSWLEMKPLAGLQWFAAPATGAFTLKWLPEEYEPHSGHISLEPAKTWQASLYGHQIQMTGGRIEWDAARGIKTTGVHFTGDLVAGEFSLEAGGKATDALQITRLEISASGDFAQLVDFYEIPIDAPTGKFNARLSLDKGWRCTLDMKGAAWGHLLGTAKRKGEAYSVHISGQDSPEAVLITAIQSKGAVLPLSGTGKATKELLLLDFRQVKTPAFDGSLRIHVPFGPSPLEVDIEADFMNRQALPKDMKPAEMQKKPWAVRAKLDQLDWDGARLYQVDVQLASSKQSIGLMRAGRLDTAMLKLTDAVASFRIPKDGVVELRELSAKLAEQKMLLTGTLTSDPNGGLRWRGFANINGDFGFMLKRLDASHKFRGGDMHALISGQGLLLPDQPWWHQLDGRMRLRVSDGRFLEGGFMTKLLAAASLADLPKLFIGQRKDLVGEGMHFDRLQLEASLSGKQAKVRQIAMRASALDTAGQGRLDLSDGFVDLTMVLRPLQNLDAVLGAIPILRDLIGGSAHSLLREVYHVYGPISTIKVENVEPEEAGLAAPGLIENLLTLPGKWFGDREQEATPE